MGRGERQKGVVAAKLDKTPAVIIQGRSEFGHRPVRRRPPNHGREQFARLDGQLIIELSCIHFRIGVEDLAERRIQRLKGLDAESGKGYELRQGRGIGWRQARLRGDCR